MSRNVYRQGEHICVVYETEDEQRMVAADYLADGLRSGERVLYVAATADALKHFRDTLARTGIDVENALRRGALTQSTHAEAHLAHGNFNSERMLVLLNRAVESALNDGFSGLRTCGDMSWLLQEPDGVDQVVEYESLLNEFFLRVRASGMCQYDRHRLSAHYLDHALATHSSAIIDSRHVANAFYRREPSRVANATDIDWKLRVLRNQF